MQRFGTRGLTTERGHLAGILAGAVVMCLVLSCAPTTTRVGEVESTPPPPESLPSTFKVLSYNAWHGLKTGAASVKPQESPQDNEARLQFQVEQIASASPDVVFLQEVNPLPRRAKAYVELLKNAGLDYSQVHQVDACGIRSSEQRALVRGLNNGLVILAKKELRLRKLVGLKLSGDIGRCGSTSGYQLEELRYALIGEITLPGTSTTYLVTSVHLHSGFEAGTGFAGQLQELHGQGQLEQYHWIRWEIEKARLRRIGELDTMARELYKLKREEGYAGIVIGGDFNFEPDFPEYEEAGLLRLTDTSIAAFDQGERNTADPTRNGRIAGANEAEIPTVLTQQFSGESPDTQERVVAAYRAETQRPRRIDYVFAESFMSEHCLRQKLFGLETDAKRMPASDHYGVLNVYSRDRTPCEKDRAKAQARY